CWRRPVPRPRSKPPVARSRLSTAPRPKARSNKRMARSGNAAGNLGGVGKFTELRQRLLFLLGALVVYRLGCYVPVPGVNPEAMLQLMESQKGTIVDMFNMFSGGA